MSEDSRKSRLNKFEKRRKNTKKISILIIIAGILILILLVFWIFGDKDPSSPDNDTTQNTDMEENLGSTDKDDGASENSGNNIGNDYFEIRETDDVEEDIAVETVQVETSDDNVIEAYTGNWQPIGTIQEGPHTTNYDTGSQDRIEIKQAVMSATGLGEDMVEHWVGNGGDQKVVATVASPSNSEIYRVYLSWVDQEGWQVNKVERLKEVEL